MEKSADICGYLKRFACMGFKCRNGRVESHVLHGSTSRGLSARFEFYDQKKHETAFRDGVILLSIQRQMRWFRVSDGGTLG